MFHGLGEPREQIPDVIENVPLSWLHKLRAFVQKNASHAVVERNVSFKDALRHSAVAQFLFSVQAAQTLIMVEKP